MTTTTFHVPTVHCRSCKLNIEEALDDVAGVVTRDVDVDAKEVTVSFDDAAVDVATIGAAIAAAGYPVEPTLGS
jgi:copper chaperone CopZ